MARIALAELGLSSATFSHIQLMGMWDHFYEESTFDTQQTTHYVNLPHVVYLNTSLDIATLPKDQHEAWRWQAVKTAVTDALVHPYVQQYAQWVLEHEPS